MESLIFRNNYKMAKIKCFLCNQSDHNELNCPKVHLALTRNNLIAKINYSEIII
jgi:hypothetical protein